MIVRAPSRSCDRATGRLTVRADASSPTGSDDRGLPTRRYLEPTLSKVLSRDVSTTISAHPHGRPPSPTRPASRSGSKPTPRRDRGPRQEDRPRRRPTSLPRRACPDRRGHGPRGGRDHRDVECGSRDDRRQTQGHPVRRHAAADEHRDRVPIRLPAAERPRRHRRAAVPGDPHQGPVAADCCSSSGARCCSP